MDDYKRIEIAIAMLASTISDRYSPRFTHNQRDIITLNALDILDGLLLKIDLHTDSIISENPPDES